MKSCFKTSYFRLDQDFVEHFHGPTQIIVQVTCLPIASSLSLSLSLVWTRERMVEFIQTFLFNSLKEEVSLLRTLSRRCNNNYSNILREKKWRDHRIVPFSRQKDKICIFFVYFCLFQAFPIVVHLHVQNHHGQRSVTKSKRSRPSLRRQMTSQKREPCARSPTRRRPAK